MKSKISISFAACSISFLGASIFTMSAMNFISASNTVLPYVFGLSFAVLMVVIGLSLSNVLPRLSRTEHLLVLALCVLLALPRLPYLLEPLLGVSVNAACWDDWWHIQEFSALSYSDRFPPASTFDPRQYLRFYYAPWIFGATLKSLLPFFSLKQVIFINFMALQLIAAYTVFYASREIFPGYRQKFSYILFIVLALFFGGFDAFFGLSNTAVGLMKNSGSFLGHAEWWADNVGLHLQYSNFFTLALWVPHHLISAISLFWAGFIFIRSDGVAGKATAGLLVAFSAFSSIFAFIGGLPLLAVVLLAHRARFLDYLVAAITAGVVCLPLLWIYLNGSPQEGFEFFGAVSKRFPSIALAAPVFLLVLALEFGPLAFAVYSGRRLLAHNRLDLALLSVATVYLLSTFLIAYSGANNYAMRGSISSIAVITYLAAKYGKSAFDIINLNKFLKFFVLIYFLGGVYEYFGFLYNSLSNFRNSFRIINYVSYTVNYSDVKFVPVDVLNTLNDDKYGWYLLEKPKPYAKSSFARPDLEIMMNGTRFRVSVGQ